MLLTPLEEKTVVEVKDFEVKDLENLDLPFTVSPLHNLSLLVMRGSTLRGCLRLQVNGTKRGGLPVLEEKHKHNYVTMVKNIEGDRKALLLELRNFIGAGGHVVAGDPKAIEIQGRHQQAVRFC